MGKTRRNKQTSSKSKTKSRKNKTKFFEDSINFTIISRFVVVAVVLLVFWRKERHASWPWLFSVSLSFSQRRGDKQAGLAPIKPKLTARFAISCHRVASSDLSIFNPFSKWNFWLFSCWSAPCWLPHRLSWRIVSCDEEERERTLKKPQLIRSCYSSTLVSCLWRGVWQNWHLPRPAEQVDLPSWHERVHQFQLHWLPRQQQPVRHQRDLRKDLQDLELCRICEET